MSIHILIFYWYPWMMLYLYLGGNFEREVGLTRQWSENKLALV